MDATPAIAVRGLRKLYGEAEAVRGIDLDVARGEVVAFLGPNGAGKTTTVEILEGYRDATSGEVSVLGEDPQSAGRAWRGRVGVVLQESEPERYLTARETIDLYAGYFAAPRSTPEVLELVGLTEHADVIGRKLSGGQQRRLDVAIALVGAPELLFLDEPTTGFDPAARRHAWEVIAGLREQTEATIFLTTHYMDEAERLADRIVVIAGGRIVGEGTPATLGGRDRAEALVTFTAPAGAELPRGAQREGDRVVVRAAHPVAALHELTGWALDRGLDLPELAVQRPSLEDVYLALVDEEDA